MGTFALLIALAAVAIPIAIAAKIVGRIREVSNRLGDPTRLQRVFAESAAAALRRAGAYPKAIARLEVLGMGVTGTRGAGDLRAALQEARAALRKSDAPASIPSAAPAPPRQLLEDALPLEPVARPRASAGHALQRPPRPRRRPQPVTPISGFEMGDHFRLAEPPEISEPHGPFPLNANWLALAALVGAAAYFVIR